MIRHIVLWRLKGDSPVEKAQRGAEVKQALESLNGKIPGMIMLQVCSDFGRTAESSDIALYAEFVDRAALDAYQKHPDHQKVMPLVREARTERRVIDFEA